MTIIKTSLEVLVNLGGYENLKVGCEAEGESTEEIKKYLSDVLKDFSNNTIDPEIKNRINSYCDRVLGNNKEETRGNTREEITCDNCEAKATEVCDICPDNEKVFEDSLAFKKASEIKTIPAKPTGKEEGTTPIIFKPDQSIEQKDKYDNGMKTKEDMRTRDANITHCHKCGAELNTNDLRLCDLLGINPVCKDCRDELREEGKIP